MKIVKVIHADTTNNTELEREYFSFKNYNANNFLLKKRAEIIEKSEKNVKEILKNKLPNVNISIPIPIHTPLFNPLNIKIHNMDMHEKIYQKIFTDLLINNTTLELLKDINCQINNVEIISLEEAKIKYPKTRNLSIGTYTLHPRNSSSLTRLEHYHKNLALEKDDELIILLCRMGAKSLRIIEIDNRQHSGTLEAGINTISVNLKGEVNLSTELEKNKDLFVRFEGNPVDIDSSLLNNSLWFSDDSKLLSIFESRRFNQNRIEEYTLVNTYTETFDFDFNLAAKFLVVQADLKAEYQMISKKERFFHIEFGR